VKKKCSGCQEIKPRTEFHSSGGRTDGLWPYCKPCRALKDRARKLRGYGLTPTQYEKLLEMQGGGCAICGKAPLPDQTLPVDHDHSCCPGAKTCGKCVRGLLCHNCNLGIGYLKDSAVLLGSATEYLDQGRLDTWLLLED
jgi:hypothetical protein